MEKIALLPGGFKPPHAGHYNAAKWLVENTNNSSVIVKVGSGVRDGISREMSLQLWTLYIQSDEDPLSNKISVQASQNNSPVRDVYEYIENPPNSEIKIIYLGLGKKDIEGGRYKNAPKYAKKGVEVEVKEIPPQDGGISGEIMRGFIKDGDKISFYNNIPNHLSAEQKGEAWNIVYSATPTQKMPIDPRAMSQMLEEDLYNPNDKVLDYMKSSEYKAGRSKPDDIDPSYKYKRGGIYGKMYEDKIEGDKSNKIFVMKSPHTPKGQKWDHIGFVLNDGRLRDMSGHRGSDKAPETYKYEDTEELFQMPKDKNEAIKKGLYAEKKLPKEITIPNTIACDIKDPDKKAENCGSFVKIVLSNNGIETTKSNWMGDIYSSINEEEKKGKTLHVYDFDDTITQVKSNIKTIITSPNDPDFFQELNIPSEDFPEKSKELESRLGHLDITYDFSEFEKQIGDAIVNTGVVNKLKKSLSNPNIKTTILTARSIGHPVTRYLKNELGLEAYVVPLGLQIDGKVLGKDKADWIEKHINKGFKNIYFIDDSEDNRTAVSALKDKYEDINLKVENPKDVKEMIGMMTEPEKRKHAKNLKRLKKDLRKQGDQYMEVPKYLKGTLKRKMYERDLKKGEERIAKSLPDKEFKKRYGKDWKSVKIATATKMAKKNENYPPYKADQVQKVRYQSSDTFTNSPKKAKKMGYLEGDTYEKMAAKGKKAGNLKQGTVRKRLRIKDGEKIPLSRITKAISSLKKRKSLSDKNKKYLKALNLAKTLKTTTNIKEGKKKKSDPKVGTGKKPKGSGRRLYTDENPSDTVSVKFSTRQDIVDTLSKASFKSKPHKRQSQVINLIHQRVRAALSKAKDPAVKKRLKSGFEYIKKRKEASKRKTQSMKKESTFTKNWWKDIINEILLTEGGAAGHMAHPFNLSNVDNGKDLLDIFEKSAESLNKNPGAIKIDGVNSSIRLVDLDGKKQFVMDRGSKQALDIKGITKADLEDRFKTKDGTPHGMIKTGGEVLDMFNEALPSIKGDLERLEAYNDPNILFNMEYVSGKTNVQDYSTNFIAIHGLNKIEMVDEPSAKTGKMLSKRLSKEISYDKSVLQSLLDNLKPIAKKRGYEVYGSVPTTMNKKPNFNSALSKNYTINAGESSETKSLGQWLNDLSDIPEKDFIGMNVGYKAGSSTINNKKIGAVSKQVYLAILNGENIDGLFDDAEDRKKAIQGFITYLATEKLGDEVLKVLDSPMGSADKHEGVVIRDKNISDVPFKITGKFILGGMQTGFR